ncbi:MAG: tetratricopeptide repeat protein [Candidatus Hydrogenedens sp.]
MSKGVRNIIVIFILCFLSLSLILHFNPFSIITRQFQNIFHIYRPVYMLKQEDYSTLLKKALLALDDDPLVYYEQTKKIVREACVAIDKKQDTSLEALFISSVQLIREQEFAKSFDQLYEIISKNPNWCEAYCYLGYIGFKYNIISIEKSIEYLRRAVECNPQKARYHSFLATVYRHQYINTKDNQYRQLAEENFEVALKLDPEDLNAYNNYANFLVEIGEYTKAEENYKKAISIYPEHGKPYYNLACVKALQGDKKSALEYLKKALDKNPDFRYDAKNDPDLEIIKDTPEFLEWVYNYLPAIPQKNNEKRQKE